MESSRYSEQGGVPAKKPVKTSLYRTELCRTFKESDWCRYGKNCKFAHGTEELRPLPQHPKFKTELCRNYHKSGFCAYGPRCKYIHNTAPQGMQIPLQSISSSSAQPQVLGGSAFSLGDSTGEAPHPLSTHPPMAAGYGLEFYAQEVALAGLPSPEPRHIHSQ